MAQSNDNELAWGDRQRCDRAMTTRPPRGTSHHSSNHGLDTHSVGRRHDFHAHNNNGFAEIPPSIDGPVSPQTPHNNSHSCRNDSDYVHQPRQSPHPPKRAAKRRMRHDLPGPAGVWFRMHHQNKFRKNAGGTNKRSAEQINNAHDVKADTELHPEETVTASTTKSSFHTKTRNQLLFHDYSSDLHDCNAWNFMCHSMHRIVPSFHAVANYLQARKADVLNNDVPHDDAIHKEDNRIHTEANLRAYKRLLRSIVPQHQALVHEIHSGKYDVHHLAPELHTHDLRVPLLYGYVSSVSCHAHYDWTAVLVDETYACGSNVDESSGAVVCWLEENLVKRYPHWIRPGVVWMIEGAKLAMFASSKEDESDRDAFRVDQASGVSVDISPSTEAARGGHAIDRMILVGESSLVYAWTPEEAGVHFTNQEFVKLMEERCNIALMEGMELGENKMKDGSNIIEKGGTADCFDLTKVDSPLSNEKSTSAVVESSDRNVISSSEGKKDSITSVCISEHSISIENVPSTVQRNVEKIGHGLMSLQRNSFSPPRYENAPIQNTGGCCDMDASIREEVNQDLSTLASPSARQHSCSSRAASSDRQGSKPQSCTGFHSCNNASVEKTSSASSTMMERQTDDSVEMSSTVKGFSPVVSTTPKQVTQQSLIAHNTTQQTVPQRSFRENSTKQKACNPMTVECPPADDYSENSDLNPPMPSTCGKQCLAPIKCVNNRSIPSPHDPSQHRSDSIIPPENSISKPSESTAIQFPLAGDSFDDSLDVDDDNLFYTMHNSTRESSKNSLHSYLKTVDMIGQQKWDAPISRSVVETFPISTTTTKPVYSSKTYGFDNIDDDMDSLTEDDDI